MAVEGSITIGIGANTDKFDKQIMALEKRIKKQEDKGIKINAELVNVQEEKAKYEELKKEAESYQATIDKIRNVQSTRAAQGLKPLELTDNAQKVVNRYNELQGKIYESANAMSKLTAKENKLLEQQSEVNSRVSEYKQKIENVKIEKQVADVEKLKSSFNSVGSSIQGAVKHVAKLALGIFGIRSAFMFLRMASSNLASYDKQYAANIEYIRYALTQMIAPVLQWIVNLAAKLLGYINAIMQGWFGINLFSRGSAKNFQKMKAGAGGVAKAVKEIKKQLAGFDEINMLTDQSDSGAGGGGGAGGAMPEFDLSKMQGEPPEWLKWIIDNKDLILSLIAGLLTTLKVLSPLIEKFGLKLGVIKALGIGIAVAGLVYAIQGLLKYLKDPSWENFGQIIQGIGIAIIGLGIAFFGLPAIIAGVIVLIVGTIIRYWEQIKAFLQKGIDWLTDKSDWVHQMFGNVIGSIYDYFVARFQAILNFANGWITSLKQVFDGFIKFFKGVFTGNWQLAFEGLKQIVSGFINNIINVFNYVMSFLRDRVALWGNVVGKAFGGAFKAVVNAVLRTIENTLNTPIRAINRLIDVINAVPGINLGKLTTFNLPRLKVGGIINMPNKGTMLGSAIGGEAGREGVIPLTDQQAMAELGREIGRHVLVNLTNITQMNGRVIGRELKQVQSEQEFAYNT